MGSQIQNVNMQPFYMNFTIILQVIFTEKMSCFFNFQHAMGNVLSVVWYHTGNEFYENLILPFYQEWLAGVLMEVKNVWKQNFTISQHLFRPWSPCNCISNTPSDGVFINGNNLLLPAWCLQKSKQILLHQSPFIYANNKTDRVFFSNKSTCCR